VYGRTVQAGAVQRGSPLASAVREGPRRFFLVLCSLPLGKASGDRKYGVSDGDHYQGDDHALEAESVVALPAQGIAEQDCEKQHDAGPEVVPPRKPPARKIPA
jgi:hypothetical protein